MLNGVTARLCPDQAAKKKWMIGGGVTAGLLVIIIIIVVATTGGDSSFNSRDVLTQYPLIDGHNDLPNKLYMYLQNDISNFKFNDSLATLPQWNPADQGKSQTDLLRLRTGMVGGQFWAAYVNCSTNFKDAVARTFDQIDVIKRLIAINQHDMDLVVSSQGIRDAFYNHRIASLIGVEGGHSIDSRLSVLRTLYNEGVRYMSLTHNCHLPWVESHIADSEPANATQTPAAQKGLSEWGKTVIAEMNRLGMIVDLSHVSNKTMADALEKSVAPVMFSHSSAYSVEAHSRNVRDEILRLVKQNDGIVMVNFGKAFVGGNNTLARVVEHIEHIRKVTESVNHIGLGADYDGTKDDMPVGLEDVSKYPALFDALIALGWSREDLGLLAGGNLLRVFTRVEAVRDELAALPATRVAEAVIPRADLARFEDAVRGCRSDFVPTPAAADTTLAADATVAQSTAAQTTAAAEQLTN